MISRRQLKYDLRTGIFLVDSSLGSARLAPFIQGSLSIDLSKSLRDEASSMADNLAFIGIGRRYRRSTPDSPWLLEHKRPNATRPVELLVRNN